MKFVKTMLLMTVATGAIAGDHDCGTYLRGQIGGSQGIQTNKDSLLPGSQKPNKSNKFGIYGGLGVEGRMSLAHHHPNLVGGFGVDVNLESTKYKQSGTPAGIAGKLSSEVKRTFVINALGQLGWKMKHNLMPYLTAGASYTQFKFSNTLQATAATYTATKKKNIVGWAGGAGLSWGINHKWAADIRYLYSVYGTTKTVMQLGPNTNNTAKAPNAYHAVTLGVSYKI